MGVNWINSSLHRNKPFLIGAFVTWIDSMKITFLLLLIKKVFLCTSITLLIKMLICDVESKPNQPQTDRQVRK